MHNLTILRKRYIPAEVVDISLDRILVADDRLLVTKWLPIRPRGDFAWGISYVDLHSFYKISRFYDHKNGFLYWYCDILQPTCTVDEETCHRTYLLTDLLVDVVLYPDGTIEVKDLEELEEAFAQGLIDEDQRRLALKAKDQLVAEMKNGTFPPKDFSYWEYEGGYVDLHTHSTCSDGTLTPRELVRKAKEAGLSAIALTDHDCMDGILDAMEAAKEVGIELIPGMECSVESGEEEGPKHIHLLAYFPNGGIEGMAELSKQYLQNRRIRAHKMAGRLTALGMPVTYEEVVKEAGGERFIGRVQFARVLLQKGYVSSIKQAFHDFIGDGKPGYVPIEGVSARQMIQTIRAFGGVPVLAHPCQILLGWEKKEQLVEQLVGYGLGGIEAYYTDHTKKDIQEALRWARKWDLAVTGGSDFHGENKPDICLGTGKGTLLVPYESVEDLKVRS